MCYNHGMTKPTTIRLDPKVRRRLERLADQLDRSAHGLMVEGIETYLQNIEDDLAWERELDRRERAWKKSGATVSLERLKPWFEAARRGVPTKVPPARKRRRA